MKYKIGELAKLFNISTNTVRRYENMGYIKSIRDKNSNYRYFCEDEVTKFMNVRLERKFDFTHAELKNLKNVILEQRIVIYENKSKELDEKIEYLKSLNSRLKGNIKILKKYDQFLEHGYVSEGVALTYVLYQHGSKITRDEKRIQKVQEFFYKAPEVQRIYLVKKEDLDKGKFILNMGWAVKTDYMERFGIKEDEYTQRSEKHIIMNEIAKMPINFERNSEEIAEKLKDLLFAERFRYMEKKNLKVCGDILGIALPVFEEDGEEVQHILFGIPFKENN